MPSRPGRLSPTRTVEQAVEESGFLELPTFRHAECVAGLPTHHRDPFDRRLIAQAEVEGLTLVTRDPVFGPYAVERIEAWRLPHAHPRPAGRTRRALQGGTPMDRYYTVLLGS